MWLYIATFVVSLVLSYSMIPKSENAVSSTLDDVNAPTAKEGGEIPVLFGTRDINSPNVVWYGDFRSVAIKKKGGKK